jgi:hypothetical protein
MREFQSNCLRLVGGQYPDTLAGNASIVIKNYYDITDAMTVVGSGGSRMNIQRTIKEFYLFNSMCVTYKNILHDKRVRTKQEISLAFLEVVARVVRHPKFYYTLINYNLPDKGKIKPSILSELLIVFNLSIDDLLLDDMLYFDELGLWRLRGYMSFVNLFKYVNYLDLIVFDCKELIMSSLK